MTERKIYSRSPITEALIDIQIISKAGFKVEELADLNKTIGYSVVKKQVEGHFNIDFSKESDFTSGSSSKQIGYRVETSDAKYVLQAKKSGFTFSRLAPYERWELLIAETKRVWDQYSAITHPTQITRCAIRFINRFDIPEESIELADYFKINPQVPAGYDLNGSYLQLVVPQNDINSNLIINQAIVPPPEGRTNVISILFDLDLAMTGGSMNIDNVWENLEKMHNRMNKIFEEVITDKAKELIS